MNYSLKSLKQMPDSYASTAYSHIWVDLKDQLLNMQGYTGMDGRVIWEETLLNLTCRIVFHCSKWVAQKMQIWTIE